ncbi:MAG TPA: hypothetical protein VFV94_13065, partial [Polyangiaceae bacterium]|nr:hypothetical protein [Polyangiaceae bacterium]
EAGAAVGHADQDDYFRIVAVTANGAHIETTLADQPSLDLAERGDYIDIASAESFSITSDFPITLMSVSASQEAAGVPRDLPGGDPSSLIIPPIEQFRSSYVFLTPDQYAFDFVRIMAPENATIVFDEEPLSKWNCVDAPAGTLTLPLSGEINYVVHTCQLGFPVIDPLERAPDNFSPGHQNDGVHVIQSDQGVGVLVDGFDRFVSYAYAAGTDLSFIVPR